MISESLKQKIQKLETDEILNALQKCGWNMSKAAKMLGISERMIGYKIKKYCIKKVNIDNYNNEKITK